MNLATDATIVLAPARPADLPLLATYMGGLRAADPMPAGTLADDATAAAAMSALIADPALGRAWVVHAAGGAVGYAVLTFVHSIEFGGRCGFVDELYVEDAARGQGVGRRALDLVAAEAQSLTVRVLLLEVSPENERAARLYERAGFGQRKYRLMVRRLASSQ
jgi:ribosomal protein S18 acetylase RimI-like enzyme